MINFPSIEYRGISSKGLFGGQPLQQGAFPKRTKPNKEDLRMSAFLGPIHYWMYEKIKNVMLRKAAIFSAFYEKYGSEVKSVCGKTRQEMVKSLVDKYNDRSLLEDAVYWYGRGKGVEAKDKYEPQDGVEEFHETINNYFLDGMPCDHVVETELNNG